MQLHNAVKSLIIAVLALGFFGSVAMAEVKIGYIDMEKAIQATKAGKSAKKTLEKEFNKRKKELSKKEADLKKMNEDLEKKALVLSDDVRLKKQQELQTEMLKYRKMIQENQIAIQKKQQKLTVPIVKKIQKIMASIAEKDNYTMILEKRENGVLWAKKSANLTDRVVKEFNK